MASNVNIRQPRKRRESISEILTNIGAIIVLGFLFFLAIGGGELIF